MELQRGRKGVKPGCKDREKREIIRQRGRWREQEERKQGKG